MFGGTFVKLLPVVIFGGNHLCSFAKIHKSHLLDVLPILRESSVKTHPDLFFSYHREIRFDVTPEPEFKPVKTSRGVSVPCRSLILTGKPRKNFAPREVPRKGRSPCKTAA